MNVQVLLFARARELAACDRVTIQLVEGANVGDLRRAIAVAYPVLQGILERSALAVNNEFAKDDLILPAKSEVALLPPVSGG